MGSNAKSLRAERFVNIYDEYNDFYADFVKTFKLSSSQRVALRHLCELAEQYGAESAENEANNITIGELFEIYRNENYKEA